MAVKRDFSLLIDIGNTFLKWGLFRPTADGKARENRVESGHALLEEIMALPAQFAKLPTPSRIVISNVAGSRMRAGAIRMLEVWPDAPPPSGWSRRNASAVSSIGIATPRNWAAIAGPR